MGVTMPLPAEQSPWNVQAPHLPQLEQHAVTERFALFVQLVEQQTADLTEIMKRCASSRCWPNWWT
jgi:hypothetical protein